jgi:hypothetical protein
MQTISRLISIQRTDTMNIVSESVFLFYFRNGSKKFDWYWRVGLCQKLTSEFNFGS